MTDLELTSCWSFIGFYKIVEWLLAALYMLWNLLKTFVDKRIKTWLSAAIQYHSANWPVSYYNEFYKSKS